MAQHDNYDRKELLNMISEAFDEEMSAGELDKRADLWYLADHSTDSEVLSKLSESRYVEIRESVAANENTSVSTLTELSKDEDWQVRETVVFNSNTPQSVIDGLKNDDNEFVRKAIILRQEKSELR